MPQNKGMDSTSDSHMMPIRDFQYLLVGIVARSLLWAKATKSTTRLNDGVTNAILQEAYPVLPNPIAFHTTNGVFNTDIDEGERSD